MHVSVDGDVKAVDFIFISHRLSNTPMQLTNIYSWDALATRGISPLHNPIPFWSESEVGRPDGRAASSARAHRYDPSIDMIPRLRGGGQCKQATQQQTVSDMCIRVHALCIGFSQSCQGHVVEHLWETENEAGMS